MADYTTTALVKTSLSITDSTWDVDIGDAVTTASLAIDAYCRRYFSSDGSATPRVFRPLDSCLVYVDDFSTTTGLVIKTDPALDGSFTTTWDATDYELEPLNGISAGIAGWPYNAIRAVGNRAFFRSQRASLQVTAKWGWAAVPVPVSRSAKLLAIDIWKRKDATWGIVGAADFGGIRVSQNIFNQVGGLLAPYRLGPVIA